MTEAPNIKLYSALLEAMREFSPVVKNATNPHLKSKYADLGAVIDAVAEPLSKHGLLIVQKFTHDQGGAILVTELIHAASGERLASEVPVVCKDPTDPQKIGAAITYYRRYSLLALLGLAPEDDDGHAAAQPPTNHPANQSAPLRRTPSPQPTPRPAAFVAAGPPYTDAEYDKVIDAAWQKAEDGETLDAIKDHINEHWARIPKPNRPATVAVVDAIERKWYTAASVAG